MALRPHILSYVVTLQTLIVQSLQVLEELWAAQPTLWRTMICTGHVSASRAQVVGQKLVRFKQSAPWRSCHSCLQTVVLAVGWVSCHNCDFRAQGHHLHCCNVPFALTMGRPATDVLLPLTASSLVAGASGTSKEDKAHLPDNSAAAEGRSDRPGDVLAAAHKCARGPAGSSRSGHRR